MNKMLFTYSKSSEDTFNDLVEDFRDLTHDYAARNVNSDIKDYETRNSTFNEAFCKYIVEKGGQNFTGLDMMKNPMTFNGNALLSRAFTTVLAQAITPTVPMMVSNNYTQLFDVIQTGFGEIPKFEIESNQYFTVYDLAEGIQSGSQQTDHNTEYTIPTYKRSISVELDWYRVASGKHDWGKFGVKVAKSFEAYIYASAVNTMSSAVTNAASLGIAGYIAANLTDSNWITVAQNVRLANGGADVYALGTPISLTHVLPSDASFRFAPTDDIVTVGYLPSYKNVPMVPLDQAIVPGTINSASVSTVVPDDMIFMIAMGSNKPVKVVFEGNNVVVSEDPTHTHDLTFGLTLSMYIGCNTIVGSKFGVIQLA